MQRTAVGDGVEEDESGEECEQELRSQVRQAGRSHRRPPPPTVEAQHGRRPGNSAAQLGRHVQQGPHRRHLPVGKKITP